MKKIKNKNYFNKWSIKKGKIKVEANAKKKRRNRKKNQRNDINSTYDNRFNERINIEYKVPQKFSILNNTEEVLHFFSDIIKDLKTKEKGIKKCFLITINMKEVEYIGTDALMYLLTLMRNTIKRNGNLILWQGSFPINPEAKKMLIESGFTRYVKTNSENVYNNTQNLQIRYGKEHDPNIISEICDIIIKKADVERRNILFIKEIINELMDNTMGHAYYGVEKPFFDKCWYIFVKCYSNKMSFTFLDNGLGIPYTVNKTLMEKFGDKIGIKRDDYYIKSALNGEFRTQTGKSNRGKGLPEIYSKVKEHKVSNFSIISNKGIFNENKSYESKEHFLGTLVYFEVQFDVLKGEIR